MAPGASAIFGSDLSEIVAAATSERVEFVEAAAGDEEVFLTWAVKYSADGEEAQYYRVEFGTLSVEQGLDSEYEHFSDTSDQTPSLRITGLENGIEHFFAVTAVYPDDSKSALSEEIAATPVDADGSDAAEIAEAASATTDDSATENDATNTTDTTETAESADDDAADTTESAETTSTSSDDSSSSSSADSSSSSSSSSSSDADAQEEEEEALSPPSAVGSFSAQKEAQSSQYKITLSWTEPQSGTSDLSGFEVEQRKQGQSDWTPVDEYGATARSATVTHADGGFSVQFRIRAVNAAGAGSARSTSVYLPKLASATSSSSSSAASTTTTNTTTNQRSATQSAQEEVADPTPTATANPSHIAGSSSQEGQDPTPQANALHSAAPDAPPSAVPSTGRGDAAPPPGWRLPATGVPLAMLLLGASMSAAGLRMATRRV